MHNDINWLPTFGPSQSVTCMLIVELVQICPCSLKTYATLKFIRSSSSSSSSSNRYHVLHLMDKPTGSSSSISQSSEGGPNGLSHGSSYKQLPCLHLPSPCNVHRFLQTWLFYNNVVSETRKLISYYIVLPANNKCYILYRCTSGWNGSMQLPCHHLHSFKHNSIIIDICSSDKTEDKLCINNDKQKADINHSIRTCEETETTFWRH